MALRATPEEIAILADVLWATRWTGLYYPAPDADSKLGWYERAKDMNGDGAVTISDVGLWAQWLFGLPGDYFLIAMMKWAPSFAHFLELGPAMLGGWLSGGLSLFGWIIIVPMIPALLLELVYALGDAYESRRDSR